MTPDTLQANAWCGQRVEGAFDAAAAVWAAQPGFLAPPVLTLGFKPADLRDWKHPDVGWGLVVPDDPNRSGADKSRGMDLSEPLQALIKQRGDAPVLRWFSGLEEGRLRRYGSDGMASDLRLSGTRGTAANAVPRYLLVAASPQAIPWRVQYQLQTEAFVGRLDLPPEGLARYVAALMADWSGSATKHRGQPLVWAVDHGHPDITRLMRKTVADRLAQSLGADAEFSMAGGYLTDGQATVPGLVQALQQRSPAFVMTSSHGATFPLSDASALRDNLGLPVDLAHQLLSPAALNSWDASGCIWVAHACCSAGADDASSFAPLFQGASTLAQTLAAVAQAGPCQAPLPTALLGGAHPARAFIGHVEPTFDWTLRDPVSGQSTTQSLIDSFYRGLHAERDARLGSMPVGMALDAHYKSVASLLLSHIEALDDINQHVAGAEDRALRAKLMAMDRLAMVILGDPTVGLAVTA